MNGWAPSAATTSPPLLIVMAEALAFFIDLNPWAADRALGKPYPHETP